MPTILHASVFFLFHLPFVGALDLYYKPIEKKEISIDEARARLIKTDHNRGCNAWFKTKGSTTETSRRATFVANIKREKINNDIRKGMYTLACINQT